MEAWSHGWAMKNSNTSARISETRLQHTHTHTGGTWSYCNQQHDRTPSVLSQVCNRYLRSVLWAWWEGLLGRVGVRDPPARDVMEESCAIELSAAASRLAHWRHVARASPSGKGMPPSAPTSGPLLSSTSSCEAQLESVEAELLTVRRVVGAASCARKQRGPTGGYCLTKRRYRRGGNHCIAPGLAATLVKDVFGPNASVLDIGCGLGQYGSWFRAHAPSLQWTGFDGAENVEDVTDGLVRFADLTDGLPRDARRKPVDWAMSLEVAEHIYRAGEAAFMHALTSLARRGVLLSWARPGQGGGGGGAKHVNCQSAEYVACAARLLGFAPDDRLQRRLVGRPNSTFPCPWLRANVMVFRRTGAVPADGTVGERLRAMLRSPLSAAFAREYTNATWRLCPYMEAACNPPPRRPLINNLWRNRTLTPLPYAALASLGGRPRE